MDNDKTMPYGFVDFTGQVWADCHVDLYNHYRRDGRPEWATKLFHDMVGVASVEVVG